MKTKTKLSPLAIALLALGSLAVSVQAIPTFISGTVSFAGTAMMDSTAFTSATRFTAFQDVSVSAESGLSGDYLGTHGAVVTLTPFIFTPSTASTPINPLWSFVSGGKTYSFDLSTLHTDYITTMGLFLSGVGTAHITGPGVEKIDTTGAWSFTAQSLGQSSFTFSSSTTVIPPPVTVPDGGTTVAMLGASFCGLALANRKKQLAKKV